VYAAGYIGGNVAISLLASYAGDPRWKVQNALQAVWDYFDPVDYAREVLAYAPLNAWRGAQTGCLTVTRPEALVALSEIPNLSAVRYNPKGVDVIDLATVVDIPYLKSLALSPRHPLNISALQGHPTLEFLSVMGAGICDGASALADMPSLMQLHFSLKNVPPDLLANIAHVSQLSDLDLYNGRLDGGLQALESVIPQLTHLGFSNVPDVDSLDLLRGSQLNWFRVVKCSISDLGPLMDASELEALWINGALSRYIHQIAQHPKLSTVLVYDTDGSSIDLSGLRERQARRALTIRMWRTDRALLVGAQDLPASVKMRYI
jgi:hypothetical protein